MQTNKNKWIGVSILALSAICFFSLSHWFNLFGSTIEYQNPQYVLKMFIADAFIPIGLYFGLYFYQDKKTAKLIGGGMAVFLIVAYVLGLLIH